MYMQHLLPTGYPLTDSATFRVNVKDAETVDVAHVSQTDDSLPSAHSPPNAGNDMHHLDIGKTILGTDATHVPEKPVTYTSNVDCTVAVCSPCHTALLRPRTWMTSTCSWSTMSCALMTLPASSNKPNPVPWSWTLAARGN